MLDKPDLETEAWLTWISKVEKVELSMNEKISKDKTL
jgi:hypothetical protein